MEAADKELAGGIWLILQISLHHPNIKQNVVLEFKQRGKNEWPGYVNF